MKWCRPRRSGERRQWRSRRLPRRVVGDPSQNRLLRSPSAESPGPGRQLRGQASRRGSLGGCSRSAGAEWGQVPPASPGGGGGSRGLGRSSGRRERCWRPLAGCRGAAAGARGAGGRWQAAVVWRPAREALEAAGVRRCAQSSQLHEAEFGGQALGGLENSGLAGGRQAGVLWPAVRRRVVDAHPPWCSWRGDASPAARRALRMQFWPAARPGVVDAHPPRWPLARARGREPCGARCAADGPVPRSGGVLLEERGT